MSTPKWFIIARNEYRVHTSRIRKIRLYFPFLVTGALAIYVLYIAPQIVKAFADDFLAFFLSQAAVAMAQIFLFLIFFYFMIIPISSALRESQHGQINIFLSAPVKSSDVLLGEFTGAIPLYAIFIIIITGFFTALLNPLNLSVIQITIIIFIFVIIFLSALWIGTVIAALLRTRLGRTAHGRDIGRGLAMILALPLVALFYILSYGRLLEKLADPGASGMVKTLLGWLPSSWGAEVIVTFAANPGSITVGWETGAQLIGIITFFGAALWVGAKLADRAYSLEQPSFIGSQAKPDGIFYKTVKFLGGGQSFGTLVVSLFKDYSRRLENISGITYMLGILALMIIFISPQSGPDEPPVGLIMTQIIFPIVVVMVTGDVTVQGKTSLYLYRKAPHGENHFIKAMILKSWLMAVPIAGVVSAAIIFITMQVPLTSLLFSTGMMMLFIAGLVLFVIGLFLLNPAFSEKSVKLWINVMISMFVSIGLLLASLVILTMGGLISDFVDWFPYLQVIQVTLCWLLGSITLYTGRMRLHRIE